MHFFHCTRKGSFFFKLHIVMLNKNSGIIVWVQLNVFLFILRQCVCVYVCVSFLSSWKPLENALYWCVSLCMWMWSYSPFDLIITQTARLCTFAYTLISVMTEQFVTTISMIDNEHCSYNILHLANVKKGLFNRLFAVLCKANWDIRGIIVVDVVCCWHRFILPSLQPLIVIYRRRHHYHHRHRDEI